MTASICFALFVKHGNLSLMRLMCAQGKKAKNEIDKTKRATS
jgi:hypothetical protein